MARCTHLALKTASAKGAHSGSSKRPPGSLLGPRSTPPRQPPSSGVHKPVGHLDKGSKAGHTASMQRFEAVRGGVNTRCGATTTQTSTAASTSGGPRACSTPSRVAAARRAFSSTPGLGFTSNDCRSRSTTAGVKLGRARLCCSSWWGESPSAAATGLTRVGQGPGATTSAGAARAATMVHASARAAAGVPTAGPPTAGLPTAATVGPRPTRPPRSPAASWWRWLLLPAALSTAG